MNTPQDRARTGRRERPAKAALSRESIVTTTLKLLDEGVDRPTMRRVAAELDTGPASLYVYVRDTEELHAAVLEELLGKSGLLDDPQDDGPTWHSSLVDLLMAYTGLLLEYPSVARVTAFTRPAGPHYIRLAERLLALLVRGGVRLREAAWGVDLLLQQAETTAAEQGSRTSGEQADDDSALRTAIRSLVAAGSPDHPQIVAAGEDLLSGEGPERGAWAFEVLLNGLLATPRPDSATGSPA
ncbi:MAG: TetR/AcrR family transcriptional regulator [Cellulomonas sp.]